MRRRFTFLTFALSVLCLSLTAGVATAGYWEVQYDLAGSNARTTIINPADMSIVNVDDDPITGTFVVQYEATSSVAPLIVGRLPSGNTHVAISQSVAGLLLISGVADTTLLPPVWGTYGSLAGQTMSLSIVADSSATGFTHCTGGACGLAGFTASVNNPLTPPGPGPFPVTFNPFVFTGVAGAGNGNWANGTVTTTIASGISA